MWHPIPGGCPTLVGASLATNKSELVTGMEGPAEGEALGPHGASPDLWGLL
jgi:hypothetical protein